MDEWIAHVVDERARLESAHEDEVVAALRAQTRTALEHVAATGGLVVDPAPAEKALRSVARGVYREAFGPSLAFHGVRAKGLREILDDLIEAYIRASVMVRMDYLTDTTRRMIAREIAAGLDAGEDTRRVAQRLLETWLAENPVDGPVTYARALRVVRTEVGGAQQASHLSGAREAGMTHKEWVSVRDARTRGPGGRYPSRGFDHREPYDPNTGEGTNGQVVRIGDPFRVSGELLQHPGDSGLGASAGNVVQCRCAVRYLFRRG